MSHHTFGYSSAEKLEIKRLKHGEKKVGDVLDMEHLIPVFFPRVEKKKRIVLKQSAEEGWADT